jgi:hypothetical protein
VLLDVEEEMLEDELDEVVLLETDELLVVLLLVVAESAR